jgi:hypothetical protein
LVKLWEKSDKNDLIEHDITKLIFDNYNNKNMFIIAVKIKYYEADLSDVICIYNNKFINWSIIFTFILSSFAIVLSGERAAFFLFLIYVFASLTLLKLKKSHKIITLSTFSIIAILLILYDTKIYNRYITQKRIPQYNTVRNWPSINPLSVILGNTVQHRIQMD